MRCVSSYIFCMRMGWILTFSFSLLSCVPAETEASKQTTAMSAEALCLFPVTTLISALFFTSHCCHPCTHSTRRTVQDEDTACRSLLALSPAHYDMMQVGGVPSNTFTHTHTAGEIPSRRSHVLLVLLLSKFVGILQGLMKEQAKLVIVINGS